MDRGVATRIPINLRIVYSADRLQRGLSRKVNDLKMLDRSEDDELKNFGRSEDDELKNIDTSEDEDVSKRTHCMVEAQRFEIAHQHHFRYFL
jgi:hypothetical protein